MIRPTCTFSVSVSVSAVYRVLYSLMVESYYSCMRVMISRERNSAVKEKQRVGKHCQIVRILNSNWTG